MNLDYPGALVLPLAVTIRSLAAACSRSTAQTSWPKTKMFTKPHSFVNPKKELLCLLWLQEIAPIPWFMAPFLQLQRLEPWRVFLMRPFVCSSAAEKGLNIQDSWDQGRPLAKSRIKFLIIRTLSHLQTPFFLVSNLFSVFGAWL